MPSDPARRKRIRELVAWVREQLPAAENLSSGPMPFRDNAEIIAFLVEQCRADGDDEAEAIEVVMLATDMPKEDLIEIETALSPLGYTVVCNTLRRLARRAAPRPPTRWERRVA